MFKKASGNVHYLGRTGSHSTKGSRRGIDHMAPMTAEDFNSEENIQARRCEKKRLRSLLAADIIQATQVKAVMLSAAESGNAELMDALRPITVELNNRIRANKARIDELKRTIPKKLHLGRRPDYEEKKIEMTKKALLKHPPIWWGEANGRRKRKYLKWLRTIGTVDETKFH